jgi:hypothetical protein
VLRSQLAGDAGIYLLIGSAQLMLVRALSAFVSMATKRQAITAAAIECAVKADAPLEN